jgi:hypothetical protein
MIVCYKYPAPEFHTPLGQVGIHYGQIFIVYDDKTGEAMFFHVTEGGDDEGEDGTPDIFPFTPLQMNLVNARYLDWCRANPDKATAAVGGAVVHFDREAYEDFMRSL